VGNRFGAHFDCLLNKNRAYVRIVNVKRQVNPGINIAGVFRR
jgi:hypothetical protein